MKNYRIAAALAAVLVTSASAAVSAQNIPDEVTDRIENREILSEAEDEREYMIFFFTDGGTEVDDMIGKCGDIITPPEDPRKEGYIFVGWNKPIPAEMPAHDMCISAVWVRA